MRIRIDKIKVNPGRRETLPEHIVCGTERNCPTSSMRDAMFYRVSFWGYMTILIIICFAIALSPFYCDKQPMSYYAPDYEASYTVGDFDQLQIWRIYRLGSADDPAHIPTKDFELNGWNYHMLRMDKDMSGGQTTYTVIFNGTKTR
jgi:hypothetical protein